MIRTMDARLVAGLAQGASDALRCGAFYEEINVNRSRSVRFAIAPLARDVMVAMLLLATLAASVPAPAQTADAQSSPHTQLLATGSPSAAMSAGPASGPLRCIAAGRYIAPRAE